MTNRETTIAELGRRHPATADDVDAVLAMPRSDAVNEGLLALAETIHKARWPDDRQMAITPFADEDSNGREYCFRIARAVAALRAVPSPDTVGVREAETLIARMALSMQCALDALRHTNRNEAALAAAESSLEITLRFEADYADKRLRLSPSHCTAGRREFKLTFSNEELSALRELSEYHQISEMQTLRQALRSYQLNDRRIREGETQTWSGDTSRAKDFYDLALTSEQSGPTAGREEVWEAVSKNVKERLGENDGMWRSCSGCYETEDGQNVHGYPHSDVFGCTLGGGCSECGGIGAVWDTTDYAAMGEELSREIFTPSPPNRQQDQDETSVVTVAWDAGEHEGCGKDSERAFKAASLPSHLEQTTSGIIDWKMEAERANRLLADIERATIEECAKHFGLMQSDHMMSIEDIVAKIRTVAHAPPVSDASREALEACRAYLVEITKPSRVGKYVGVISSYHPCHALIDKIDAALNNSFGKTGGGE